jgi:hypothetical protein
MHIYIIVRTTFTVSPNDLDVKCADSVNLIRLRVRAITPYRHSYSCVMFN